MIRLVRRRIGMALDRRFKAVNSRVESVERSVEALATELDSVRETNAAALRLLVQDHAGNRRRLRELREEPSYSAVFDDARPLVSVVIPTYDNTELLLERSLPSVLGQSYERLEILVIGDAAAPEVGRAVDALGDARVRFVNLPYRIQNPDPYTHWVVGSVAARNAGRDLARGSWLVDFDDDDELRPSAIDRGLALARERRLELSYGPFASHWHDGTVETVASYPPQFARFAMQGALMHRGLRFFERSPAAGVFGVPNDWFLAEAMLRAGVRFGMHDEVVFDYFPSLHPPDPN
jgi:hypothetical protein